MKSSIGFSAVVVASALLVGCSGLKTREEVEPATPPNATGSVQTGTEAPPRAEVPPPAQPAPTSPVQSSRVAVILGPGGIKSFAHVGVLKELVKARVPIDIVVGVEWGSLIGALYSQNGKIPDVEWKLYKMQKGDLPGKGLFSGRVNAESIKTMDSFLSESFGAGAVEQTKIEFACPSLSMWTGTVVWQTRGDLKGVLSRCMPYPPMYRPSSPWMAAPFSVDEAVRFLKKKGYQIIVYVDVLGLGDLLPKDEAFEGYESTLLWHEIRRAQRANQKQATDVIEVDTTAFRIIGFDGRTALVGAGESAGVRAARKLADKYGF